MVLIIGGAYQGKTAYAKQTYGIQDTDIFTCSGEALNLSARCLRHLERFARACVRAGKEPAAVLAGLDLGEYRADTTHAQGGDSQTYLADFYIGMRGAWNTGTEENLAGGEELWQALTAGAVSTAGEGH